VTQAPPVRRAGPRDLDRLAALWTALLAHHAGLDPVYRAGSGAEAAWRHLAEGLLARPGAALFVSESGGVPVGLCAVEIAQASPFLAERARAEITELWVEPAARRRGVGRALAEAALAFAGSRGVSRVEIRVHARNAEGRSFWRALGFEPFVDVLARRL
jgi:ribosomal protein S18 acetylase RimI-like enzyme